MRRRWGRLIPLRRLQASPRMSQVWSLSHRPMLQKPGSYAQAQLQLQNLQARHLRVTTQSSTCRISKAKLALLHQTDYIFTAVFTCYHSSNLVECGPTRSWSGRFCITGSWWSSKLVCHSQCNHRHSFCVRDDLENLCPWMSRFLVWWGSWLELFWFCHCFCVRLGFGGGYYSFLVVLLARYGTSTAHEIYPSCSGHSWHSGGANLPLHHSPPNFGFVHHQYHELFVLDSSSLDSGFLPLCSSDHSDGVGPLSALGCWCYHWSNHVSAATAKVLGLSSGEHLGLQKGGGSHQGDDATVMCRFWRICWQQESLFFFLQGMVV